MTPTIDSQKSAPLQRTQSIQAPPLEKPVKPGILSLLNSVLLSMIPVSKIQQYQQNIRDSRPASPTEKSPELNHPKVVAAGSKFSTQSKLNNWAKSIMTPYYFRSILKFIKLQAMKKELVADLINALKQPSLINDAVLIAEQLDVIQTELSSIDIQNNENSKNNFINALKDKFRAKFPEAKNEQLDILITALNKTFETLSKTSFLLGENRFWTLTQHELGAGSDATVLEAQEQEWLDFGQKKNEFFAVKKFMSDKRNKALEEFNGLRRLPDHPSLPKAHALIEKDGNTYLVMDKVTGQSLGRDLFQNKFKKQPQLLYQAITSLINTVVMLAENNIVHGDIKLENMKYTPQIDAQAPTTEIGAITLFDFGEANPLQEITLQSADDVSCSDGYMPPECDYDQQQWPVTLHNQSIELYSLGKTIDCLLHGVDSPDELNNFSPRKPSPEEQSFLEKMLHPNPAERYQTPAEILAAWATVRTITDTIQTPEK